MTRETLDRWCERGILALVLAILVFSPLAIGAVRVSEFVVVEGLAAGILVLWCARLWTSAKPRWWWPPVSWAIVAFLIYALGRYATADIEYVARQEVLQVAVWTTVFLSIVIHLPRQDYSQVIVFTLVFLAMLVSGYAIFQFLGGTNKVWHFTRVYTRQGSGTYINPNHLGGLLEMVLPLALAFTLVSRVKALPRVFLGYAALVVLAGIAVTVSRGAWISTGLALMLLFGALLTHRRYRIPALVLLIVMIGGLVWLAPQSHVFRKRTKLLYETGKLDDSGRYVMWRVAGSLWKENPWWGVGPAHFDARFRPMRPENVQLSPNRAHNDYLNLLTDWGAVGGALIAAGWMLLAAGAWKTWRSVRRAEPDFGESRSSNKFAVVLGATIGLAAILFHSFVDFNLHIPANALVVATLMALLASHLRFATDKFWWTVRPWTKPLLACVLLAAAMTLATQAVRGGRESFWIALARCAPGFSSDQVALLERAAAIEPKNGDTAAAIGEAFRVQSQEGGEVYADSQDGNYEARAKQAMIWFDRAIKLNAWNASALLGYGWCLDWLQRFDDAAPYFDRANLLDPNSHFTMATIGRHYLESGNYAAARTFFERSKRLQFDNEIADNYLALCQSRMLEMATNDFAARLAVPSSPLISLGWLAFEVTCDPGVDPVGQSSDWPKYCC